MSHLHPPSLTASRFGIGETVRAEDNRYKEEETRERTEGKEMIGKERKA